jgi:hypothetical protein
MKRNKPMGLKKYKATAKKQFMKSLRAYTEQLENELRQIHGDPATVIGRLSQGYQSALSASKRLSVLCAVLIKTLGGKVEVLKAELESFKGQAINVKWELPEGVKPEDARSYLFYYETMPEGQPGQQGQEAAKAPEAGPQGPPPDDAEEGRPSSEEASPIPSEDQPSSGAASPGSPQEPVPEPQPEVDHPDGGPEPILDVPPPSSPESPPS